MPNVRNDSGIKQVFYGKDGRKHVVAPGGFVAEEHVTRDLRVILAAPYEVPRRPYPMISRQVRVGNSRKGDPLTHSVTTPATAANRKTFLRETPTIRTPYPEQLPSWLSWLAATKAPDARWLLAAEFKWSGPSDEARTADLVNSMRSVLRGESVEGLHLLRGSGIRDGEKRPLVIVCVYNAPRWTLDSLAAVEKDYDLPRCDLAILDDGSCPAAADALAAFLRPRGWEEGQEVSTPTAGSWEPCSRYDADDRIDGFYMRRSNRGYLASANEAAELYDPDRHDCVVFLNSDTIPGPGWLRALRRALAPEKVAAANPLSNENVTWSIALPPGSDPSDLSDALLVSSDGKPGDALCPSGFCLAIKGEVWEKLGPFDAELWGRGYGEETHFVLEARKAGYTCVHTTEAFVFHAKSKSFGASTGISASRSAFQKIRKLHGSWFDNLHRRYHDAAPFAAIARRSNALDRLPWRGDPRKRVAFFPKTTLLCGGVLAVVYLADALRRQGWEARIVTFEPRDLDLYPGRSQPFSFDGDPDMRRNFAREIFSSGFLVSASWVTYETCAHIAHHNPEIVPVSFIQDDERRFDHNRGLGRKIERTWRDPGAVVNSEWVADEVEDVIGRRPRVIPVGVDPLTFYPRPRKEGKPLRVVAMSRPETSHRGTDKLLRALEIAHRAGIPLQVTLFGSRPARLAFDFEYIGRVSHDTLSGFVARADVLVDASDFQGFGLDAVQALASGAALICTDNGGSSEYAVHESNSLVVPPGDPQAIAEALGRLHNDRDLLARLQGAGRASVERLAWDTLATQWGNHLLSLL